MNEKRSNKLEVACRIVLFIFWLGFSFLLAWGLGWDIAFLVECRGYDCGPGFHTTGAIAAGVSFVVILIMLSGLVRYNDEERSENDA